MIRIARADDAAALAELSTQLGYPMSIRQAQDRWALLAGSESHHVMVEEEGGEVIGWIHVFVSLRLESDPAAEIGGLVVAEAHRNRGVGGRLVAAAEGWASERGLSRMRVRSRVEREAAHRFYELGGYRRIKRQQVLEKALS